MFMMSNPMVSELARMQPNQERQRIPTQVPRMGDGGIMGQQQQMQPQMPPMMQGLGSGSQGMFQNYMSQIFNQHYTPQPMEGIYGQQPGGYMGFFGRQLPAAPQQQQQQQQQSGTVNPSDPNGLMGGLPWADRFSTGA